MIRHQATAYTDSITISTRTQTYIKIQKENSSSDVNNHVTHTQEASTEEKNTDDFFRRTSYMCSKYLFKHISNAIKNRV